MNFIIFLIISLLVQNSLSLFASSTQPEFETTDRELDFTPPTTPSSKTSSTKSKKKSQKKESTPVRSNTAATPSPIAEPAPENSVALSPTVTVPKLEDAAPEPQDRLLPVPKEFVIPKHLEFIVTQLNPLFEDEAYRNLLERPLPHCALTKILSKAYQKSSLGDLFEAFKTALTWYLEHKNKSECSAKEASSTYKTVIDVRFFLTFLLAHQGTRSNDIVLQCIRECIRQSIFDNTAEESMFNTSNPFNYPSNNILNIHSALSENYLHWFFENALDVYEADLKGETEKVKEGSKKLFDILKSHFYETSTLRAEHTAIVAQVPLDFHSPTPAPDCYVYDFKPLAKAIAGIFDTKLSEYKTELSYEYFIAKLFYAKLPDPIIDWIIHLLEQQAFLEKQKKQEQEIQKVAKLEAWDANFNTLLESFESKDISSPKKGSQKKSSSKKHSKKSSASRPVEQKSFSDMPEDTYSEDAIALDEQIQQIYERHVPKPEDLAGFAAYQVAHANRTTIQDGDIPGSKIIHDPCAGKIIHLLLPTEKSPHVPVWFRVGQIFYHTRIGSEGKNDYRHMFPESVARFLEYATWSKRESSGGELQDHAEITGTITDTATGKAFPCIFEFTFANGTHTCYHRFASRQRASSSS